MKNAYLALAAVAMMILASVSIVRAETEPRIPTPADAVPALERTLPLDDAEYDPLGLLWDEDGLFFDEEIIIKDGLVYT